MGEGQILSLASHEPLSTEPGAAINHCQVWPESKNPLSSFLFSENKKKKAKLHSGLLYILSPKHTHTFFFISLVTHFIVYLSLINDAMMFVTANNRKLHFSCLFPYVNLFM